MLCLNNELQNYSNYRVLNQAVICNITSLERENALKGEIRQCECTFFLIVCECVWAPLIEVLQFNPREHFLQHVVLLGWARLYPKALPFGSKWTLVHMLHFREINIHICWKAHSTAPHSQAHGLDSPGSLHFHAWVFPPFISLSFSLRCSICTQPTPWWQT